MKIKIKRKIRKGTSAKKIIEYLLTDRGITDKREFLHPRHPKYVSFAEFFGYSKKYKKNLDKTLKLLKNIRDRGEMVVVYTDYDADGLTGGAILWETLHKLGFKVMPYVPHRKREGYGFSRTGIDRVIKKYKPVLIISVDHGIVAHDEIEYASQKGIPIIVTDHHQKARTLPKAFAVFHTSELSGSGVAYFFAKEIFENFQLSRLPKTDYRDGGQETFRPKDDQPLADNSQLENHFSNDYLSLAAIGTIADLVRLTGHNRGIVEHGLSSFARTSRPGLKEIIREAEISGRQIGTYEVGYLVSPRINAFGRIADPTDALRLLCTTNRVKAKELAERAGQVNRQRQELVETAVDEAEGRVDTDQKILIVESDTWEEGIIGLVAGKLAEKYYRPAIAMRISDEQIKASVRSVSSIDIIKFLRSLGKLYESIGGHPGAAGFTITKKNLKRFVSVAQKRAKGAFSKALLTRRLTVDAQLPLSDADLSLARALEQLAPFGMGNPRPVFLSKGELMDVSYIGKDRQHARLVLRAQNAALSEVLFFRISGRFQSFQPTQILSVVYSLGVDRWRGKEKVKRVGKNIDDIGQ